MKITFTLLFFSFFLFGCATSFVPFAELESIGDSEASNEDLEIIVGIQPLGDNSRFKDTAEENDITILKLNLKNISNNVISLSTKHIFLRGIPDNEPISQLSPEDVSDRMSLASWTYGLWSLLWLGYHENNNGETSGFWLPIGLPIGAINFFKARSTNDGFENEITQNAFPDVELEPNNEQSGMLFFNRSGGIKYNLVIAYINNLGVKKEVSIPYKF